MDEYNLPMRGTESDVAGMISATRSMKTVSESSTVMPGVRDTEGEHDRLHNDTIGFQNICDGTQLPESEFRFWMCVFKPSSPREIFSPESAGSRNTSRANPEISTQGMSKLRP